jgi:perosamine synthetase
MASPERRIPLSKPSLTGAERSAVLEVLETPELSCGPKLPEFEENLARFAGVKHAVAVNSGTSGLHLGVRAAGVRDGDEVITTPFSFVASANCVLYERALPVFVDVDRSTLNIDVARIEAAITPRTKAILPVHIFGLPCEMDVINDVAERHNLCVIEDACEALGASYHGRPAGGIGDCGVLAFYPNKQITTGEGGAILTNRDDIAGLCRSMRNHGRADDGRLAHVRLGYNYRLSELQCALGIAQLDRAEELLSAREAVAETYRRELAGVPVQLLEPVAGTKRSWWVFVVLVEASLAGAGRDLLLQRLRQRGIGCSNYFPPIHLQPFYAETFGYAPGDFPITESIASRTVALPFYAGLPPDDIAYVAETFAAELRELSPSSISR